MAIIRVFHNNNFRDAVLFGYQPVHTLTEVYRYPPADDDRSHPQYAYDLFNVGDDPSIFERPDQRAIEYRALANRSLSVGDVIAIQDSDGDTRWYACATVGWDTLDTPPVIHNQEHHGTTPYDAPLITYTVRFDSPFALTVQPWQTTAYARSQLARHIREYLTGQLNTEHAAVVLTPDPIGGYTGIARTGNGRVELAAFVARPDMQAQRTRGAAPE